jgi:hypothetical protein
MTQQLHQNGHDVINSNRVYRKLQSGDSNRSYVLSIPREWAKEWYGNGTKLCGYVRMTRNPDSSILLEESSYVQYWSV